MTTHWYESPAAQALIDALFRLDSIATSLNEHRIELGATGEDPVLATGRFYEGHSRVGLAHDYGRRWKATGAGATEACFNALGGLRTSWIEKQVGASWSRATNEQANLLLAAEDETPSVDDAINAYQRNLIELRRVA